MSSGGPVLVFAYANDRHDDKRFLRNLPEERRRMRKALQGAAEQGQCEVVVLPNATIEEVLEECQRKSRRISLIHFGFGGGISEIRSRRVRRATLAAVETTTTAG
jgi:hypothetical protein